MAPFVVFWVFQVLWAYYHVVRQHYGFMAMYQRLNGEADGRANAADYWIFHVLMFGPVVAWFLRYPDFRTLLGWSLVPSTLERVIVGLTLPMVAVTIVLYTAKELVRYRRTRRVNLPKSALLIAYVPLHLLLLLNPTVTGAYDILLFNAVVTFPHNLQYVAFVWFYNRNRYGEAATVAHHGLAAPANRTLGRFALAAASFSIVLFYSRFYLEGLPVPFGVGQYEGARLFVGSNFRVSDLIAATWIGVVFHHQYLDQKIWKISRDRTLVRDLRLPDRAAPAIAV
jgi:hypothetical protein